MGRLSPASPNYPWTCVARSMQLHGSQLAKGQTGAEKNERGGFRAASFYSGGADAASLILCADHRTQTAGGGQTAEGRSCASPAVCPLPTCCVLRSAFCPLSSGADNTTTNPAANSKRPCPASSRVPLTPRVAVPR